MAHTLPNTFVLKSSSNNKYLSYIKEGGEARGLPKFSAADVSELTVFEAEPAADGGNGMVHIKCCYNNKYWRRRSAAENWIAAEADEPEEDLSKWSCTLFRANFVNGDHKSLQLIHVQLGHYASVRRNAGEPFSYCLHALGPNPDNDKLDVLTITELITRSREIKDVKFNLKAAKYKEKTVELGRTLRINNDYYSNQVVDVEIVFDYKEMRTWKAKSLLNSEKVATYISSAMPVVVNGEIELTGDELTAPYHMGKTTVTKHSGKTKHKVVVQPRIQFEVTLTATQAEFDVPFTFTRQDTLSVSDGKDEKVLTFNSNHGMYTGVTHFDLRFGITGMKSRD